MPPPHMTAMRPRSPSMTGVVNPLSVALRPTDLGGRGSKLAGMPSETSMSRSSLNSTSTVNTALSTPTDDVFDSASYSQMTSAELLHAELRLMLSGRPRLQVPKTPDVPLRASSSEDEVANWLRVKGFKDDVVKRLVGLKGDTLLNLKKADLQRLLDPVVDEKEIWRLDSQLKIQRSTNPFQTVGTSEFKAVLARARRKAEEALAEQEDENVGAATVC